MTLPFFRTLGLLSLMGAVHAFAAASLPEAQKIDQILQAHWESEKLTPQALASDEVFLRRVYLDVVGRIPTMGEARAFLDSAAPGKRAELIDELLGSPGYASHSFNYFADLLRLLTDAKDSLAGQAYADWLKKALLENRPFDDMVRELLTTDGAAWDSGAIGFYMRDRGMPLDHLAATVQVFLGTRIECAQCHNHPFDKWSQMDYYKMAAFTYGMDTRGNYGLNPKQMGDRRKITKEDRESFQQVKESLSEVMKPLRYTMISESDKLPKLPADYQYDDAKPNETVEAATMFGHDAVPGEGETRLDAFAKWMTDPQNPRFTTVIANRMWKRVMGVGLIEPVDEITDSTVPMVPELMTYLEELMVAKDYNLKSYLRVLLNSDAYQRMPSEKEIDLGEVYGFTGPVMHRMSAEQLWDSLATLVAGDIDDKAVHADERNAARLTALSQLYDAVNGKTPMELVATIKANQASAGGDQEKKIDQLTEQMNEARTAGDKDKARELAAEVATLRQGGKREAFVAVLGADGAAEFESEMRAAGKVAPKNEGKKTAMNAGLSRDEMRAMLKNGMSKEEIREKDSELRLQAKSANAAGSMMRASELESPAPRGHFLRTFGQSDRETIENANLETSVPQALKLLNGPVLPLLLAPGNAFSTAVEEAKTPLEKADVLYLAMLTRRPTADERQILRGVFQDRGEAATADVVHALLNTGEFLFVR